MEDVAGRLDQTIADALALREIMVDEQWLEFQEYRILTRQRNGVEGIPSVLRWKYHVDHISTRGLLRSKTFFLLKVGAYNIKKLLESILR